jgi:hypothetical protein
MAKPSSETAVVNLALGHLKVDPIISISPPDPDSKEAAAGAKWFDQARRHVLEDHPWKFAQKRASLVAESDEPEFEWDNKFELPNDYIRLNRLGEDWDNPILDYEIEGKYVLCNEAAPLLIVYGYDLKDITKFSPKAITAMSYALASFMSYEITGNASMRDDMWAAYKEALSTAASVAGQNRPTRRIQRSRLAEARRNGASARNWRSWGAD